MKQYVASCGVFCQNFLVDSNSRAKDVCSDIIDYFKLKPDSLTGFSLFVEMGDKCKYMLITFFKMFNSMNDGGGEY